MARIFNIYFSYEGTSYHAIVSVRKTPFFTEFTLNNLPENLNDLLPGNKIISRSPGHFIFQHASVEHPQELLNAIINAVSEHMDSIKITN